MSAKLPTGTFTRAAASSTKRAKAFNYPSSNVASSSRATSSFSSAGSSSGAQAVTSAPNSAAGSSSHAAFLASSASTSPGNSRATAAAAAMALTAAGWTPASHARLLKAARNLSRQRTYHLWNASSSLNEARASSSASYHTGAGIGSSAGPLRGASDLGVVVVDLSNPSPSASHGAEYDPEIFFHPRPDPGLDVPLDLWAKGPPSNSPGHDFFGADFPSWNSSAVTTWEQALQQGLSSVYLRDVGSSSGFGGTNPFGSNSNGASGHGGFRPPGGRSFDSGAPSSPSPKDGASQSQSYHLTPIGNSGDGSGGSGSQSGPSSTTYQIGTFSAYPTGPSASSSGALTGHTSPGQAPVYQRADPPSGPKLNPLMARAISIPRARKPDFTFSHGAYGIPKRHPLALPPKRKAKKQGSGGAMSMLSAAADFLAGPQVPMEEVKPVAPAPSDATQQAEAPEASKGTPGHVAGQATRKGNGTERLKLRENGKLIPDRLRSVQVGEDAYFLRPDALGVADGVGGWATRPGANAALYSRLLMHFCSVELSRYDGLSKDELAANNGALLQKWASIDPVEVMHRAWERCVRTARREGILGSSTALLAVLRGDELRVANLGDCVLLIIRDGDMLFRSTEQQHSFNFPVQLGMMGDTIEMVTERIKAVAAAKENQSNESLEATAAMESQADEENLDDVEAESQEKEREAAMNAQSQAQQADPDDAEWDEPRRDAGRWTVRVQRGDIIILGSDGLVDNLFDEDILEEVLRFAPNHGANLIPPESEEEVMRPRRKAPGSVIPPNFSPQDVSEALCSRAKAVSEDSRAISSPFQQRAMEEGLHYVGGKHDDISVLVAVVGDKEDGSAGVSLSQAGAHL